MTNCKTHYSDRSSVVISLMRLSSLCDSDVMFYYIVLVQIDSYGISYMKVTTSVCYGFINMFCYKNTVQVLSFRIGYQDKTTTHVCMMQPYNRTDLNTIIYRVISWIFVFRSTIIGMEEKESFLQKPTSQSALPEEKIYPDDQVLNQTIAMDSIPSESPINESDQYSNNQPTDKQHCDTGDKIDAQYLVGPENIERTNPSQRPVDFHPIRSQVTPATTKESSTSQQPRRPKRLKRGKSYYASVYIFQFFRFFRHINRRAAW